MDAMDLPTETLALFAELPDADQQLFLQLGEDLDTFTLFSKLPIELRVKIWRLNFPNPRSVCLNCQCPEEDKCFACYRRLKAAICKPLPLTLHISSESRDETLQHYTFIFTDDLLPESGSSTFPDTFLHRAIWFDPVRDSVYLDYRCINQSRFYFGRWMSRLSAAAPEQLAKIKNLEVRLSDDLDIMEGSLEELVASSSTKHPSSFSWYQTGYGARRDPTFEGIFHLTSLQKVMFHVCPEPDCEPRVTERLLVLIGEYLNLHKHVFAGEKALAVVMDLGGC